MVMCSVSRYTDRGSHHGRAFTPEAKPSLGAHVVRAEAIHHPLDRAVLCVQLSRVVERARAQRRTAVCQAVDGVDVGMAGVVLHHDHRGHELSERAQLRPQAGVHLGGGVPGVVVLGDDHERRSQLLDPGRHLRHHAPHTEPPSVATPRVQPVWMMGVIDQRWWVPKWFIPGIQAAACESPNTTNRRRTSTLPEVQCLPRPPRTTQPVGMSSGRSMSVGSSGDGIGSANRAGETLCRPPR